MYICSWEFYIFHNKKKKKTLKKKKTEIGDFPGGSVAENLPCNAGDANLIPVGETKIPLDWEKLSFRTTTRESVRHQQRFQVLQQRPDTIK